MSATKAAAARWRLYGLPLSQPFRSVAWALLQREVRFDIQLTVPGSDGKVGSRNELYTSKSRMKTTRIPLLEDTHSGVTIAESPAILSHLCEQYGWDDSLYGPAGSAKKATIDSYMHYHHSGTRKVALLAFPFLRAGGSGKPEPELVAKTMQILEELENGWFSQVSSGPDDQFLAGGTRPSIADLLAYEEIAQLTMLGLLSEKDVPTKISSWLQRMEQMPFHQEAHASLLALGDVTTETDIPLLKRLGAANKIGIQALTEAQTNFPEEARAKL